MAGQAYLIQGKLTSRVLGRRLEDVKVMAYRPLGVSSMQNLGLCSVKSDGKFVLKFKYGTVGSPPVEVHIMAVPAEIERFGVLKINQTAFGTYVPKESIAAGEWRDTGGVYEIKTSMEIAPKVWSIWDWLCEEFTIIGNVVKLEGEVHLPVPYASVRATDIDGTRSGGSIGMADTDEAGNFTISFRRLNFFVDYAALSLRPRRYGIESWPDVIFHIVQKVGGAKTIIYEEERDEVRPNSMWDVPRRILHVTLVTEKGVVNDEVYPPIPAGENFLFHGIGLVKPHSLSDGYATTGPAEDLPNRKDCPFGSTLHIKGQFDTTVVSPPKYYQVLFAKWSGAAVPVEADFSPILHESWTVSKYDSLTGDWTPKIIEPESGIVAGEKVYEIPDYMDITQTTKTRLISWRTHRKDAGIARYPDGKYDVLIKAWDAAGNPVVLNAARPENNRLTVVLDNARPTALLKKLGPHDILRTDEMMPYTPTCPVFSKTLGTLNVEFDAIDEQEHFLKYQLSFITGHNFYVDRMLKVYDGKFMLNERFKVTRIHKQIGTGIEFTVHPADDIQPPGGFPSEIVPWSVASPDAVRCAYQVRLSVWSRTINGYGYIHYAEDTMHFSLEP
ncbi:MAG: hypothetical protein GY765_40255 [bacterium]|nr:hypothetical protein [bacterium]